MQPLNKQIPHTYPIHTMSEKLTTTEELQSLAQSMISEKIDVTPYKNLGTLVLVDSQEYRIRMKQCVIVVAEIEYAGKQFAYFMT
jgi:hypothetical protein